MAMSKKDFIALANIIKAHNGANIGLVPDVRFYSQHLYTLADFCQQQNPRFNRERWIGYIRGQNGLSGGKKSPMRDTGPFGKYEDYE